MPLFDNITLPTDTKLGWVSQPNQRGTLDIIWSCLLVVFTSTWSVLHLHPPSATEGYWQIFLRKLRWSIFAVYFPEALTLAASNQWASARESVRQMHNIGVKDWSIVHGFYADSGGFILRPVDTPPFPINTRAIHYLIKNKYIEVPSITRKEIENLGKADRFAKVVAIVQSSYLLIQCIARAVQSLDVTALELLTVAFVLCTGVSYCFWFNKPQDIAFHTHLDVDTPMAEILIQAGDCAKEPYENTPMDFVEQPGWSVWTRRRVFATFGGLDERPIARIPNDYAPPPPSTLLASALLMVTIAHAAIHVAGWNLAFPTYAETILWRCASLTFLVDIFFWGLIQVLSVSISFDFTITILGVWAMRSKKNSFLRRWALDGPALASVLILGLARTVLLAQALVSLRLMPSTLYLTVQWTSFIPHV